MNSLNASDKVCLIQKTNVVKKCRCAHTHVWHVAGGLSCHDFVVTDTPEANLQYSGVTESVSGGCAGGVIGSQVSESLGFDKYLRHAFTNTLVKISW